MVTTRKRAYQDEREDKFKRARHRSVAAGKGRIIKNPTEARKQDAATQTDVEVDDDATEVLDPYFVDLHAAVSCLNGMADLLKYGRIADDGEILSSMRDVWEHLTKAHEHWHHPLKDSGQSETLSMMQGSNYTYDQHCGHRLSFLENCMFLSIAGEVLRKEVFEKDLLSELRAQSLLPESLGPLKECASTVYNFLVVAYFWQQSYHLDENALRAYDAKFEARLGKYDSTCYKHLQEATCVSIQLRLYLLLVDEVYKFEYPKDIEVDDSKTGAALQGCHVVLPAVRSKGNTVVKCRSVCVSRGSDFAKVTGPGKE